MFWLLFVVFMFILGVVFVHKDADAELIAPTIAMLIMSFIITGVVVGVGLATYPILVGRQAELQSLKGEIETIRNASYQIESGDLVAGSLDNFQQSTVLSEYIRMYAEKKAKYNSSIVRTKLNRKLQGIRWFGCGWFISEKVEELKQL